MCPVKNFIGLVKLEKSTILKSWATAGMNKRGTLKLRELRKKTIGLVKTKS